MSMSTKSNTLPVNLFIRHSIEEDKQKFLSTTCKPCVIAIDFMDCMKLGSGQALATVIKSANIPKRYCKGDFDHELIQDREDVVRYARAWKPYLENDVRCMALWFASMFALFEALPHASMEKRVTGYKPKTSHYTPKINLYHYWTLPQIAEIYIFWKTKENSKNYIKCPQKTPLHSKEDVRAFVQDATCGGKVDNFRLEMPLSLDEFARHHSLPPLTPFVALIGYQPHHSKVELLFGLIGEAAHVYERTRAEKSHFQAWGKIVYKCLADMDTDYGARERWSIRRSQQIGKMTLALKRVFLSHPTIIKHPEACSSMLYDHVGYVFGYSSLEWHQVDELYNFVNQCVKTVKLWETALSAHFDPYNPKYSAVVAAELDANSLYPDVMANFPLPTGYKPVNCDLSDIDRLRTPSDELNATYDRLFHQFKDANRKKKTRIDRHDVRARHDYSFGSRSDIVSL